MSMYSSSMDHLILLPSVLLETYSPENLIFKSPNLFKLSKNTSQLSSLQFTNNGTFFVCVNNMNDQANANISNEIQSRPGSAQQTAGKTPSKADQQRLEKIQQLREKQNSERLKKLEELKEHAAAAVRLREEQEARRRNHFSELSKKDEDRRRAAEERRKLLDEERKTALMSKFESKRMTSSMISQNSRASERKYAFGSCTPRLIENYDGFLWKSQYNLNLSPATPASSDSNGRSASARATSAQDLLSGSDNDTSGGRFFFCGRRKTDLTPTIPIRRSDQSSQSGRTSGRLSSKSLTRLDKFQSNNSGSDRTPSNLHSRSKSTNQLFRLTRTEVLRQEKAKKKEGFSSAISTRPPSSMSNSIMTSSTHSGVNMRSRPTRKPRPVSVHVTGVSTNTPITSQEEKKSKFEDRNILGRKLFEEKQSARNEKSSTPRPSSRDGSKSSTTVNNIKSPAEEKPKKDFSTIKRASSAKPKKIVEEKKPTATPTSKSNTTNGGAGDQNKNQTPQRKTITTSAPANDSDKNTNQPISVDNDKSAIISKENESFSSSSSVLVNKENDVVVQNVNVDDNLITIDEKDKEVTEVVKPQDNVKSVNPFEENKVLVEIDLVKVNGISPSSSQNDDENNKVSAINNETVNQLEQKVDGVVVVAASEKNKPSEQNDVIFDTNTPTTNNVLPTATFNDNATTPVASTPEQNEESSTGGTQKPKIINEEQAKAALAEKRRLAREAQMALQAKLEEEARLELEKQREEEENALRILEEAKKAEEERLLRAIRERELQEEEEKKRREQEEAARIEKELADKEAAREAERVRLEMEERLRREEEERLERRKRVENIMKRTRIRDAVGGQQQQPTIDTKTIDRKNQDNLQQQENNLKNNIAQQQEDPVTISTSTIENTMNLQNNSFNQNNNNTLINFDDSNDLININNSNNSTIEGAIETTGSNNAAATIQDLLS